MVVETDADVVVRGGIDEPKTVLLALLKAQDLVVGAIAIGILVGTVDQDRIGGRWWRRCLQIGVRLILYHPPGFIVVVDDNVRPKIVVIVGRSEPVDDDGSECTGAILGAEMRVIPSCAMLGRMEGIGLAVAGSKRALCDTADTVLWAGV